MKSDDPDGPRDDPLHESSTSIAKASSEQPTPHSVDLVSQPTTTSTPSSTDHSSSSSETDNMEISPVGHATIKFSDLVNDNLIAARYITTATIGLLAAYGIAHTPLFFRYRTVSELPSSLFRSRKRIRCRLVKSLASDMPIQTTTTASSSTTNHPILLQVRHLSPFESFFMSKTWYDRWIQWHPAAAVARQSSLTTTSHRRHDEDEQELLTIQIAGIEEAPPFYYNNNASGGRGSGGERPNEWLNRLVTDRTQVTCQLLARRRRRVFTAEYDHEKGTTKDASRSSNSSSSSSSSILSGGKIKKRALRDIQFASNNNTCASNSDWDTNLMSTANDNKMPSSSSSSFFSNPRNEIAIVKLYYRPKPFQLFATDIGQSMVRFGRATMSESNLYLKQDPNDQILDASDAVRDLQKDAAYLDQLSRAEYEAASGSYGLWGDATIRASKPTVVEEVEFQTTAPWWRKVWRWIRGG